MKILSLLLLSAAAAGAAITTSATSSAMGRSYDPTVPAESWAPKDTADTLWRRGRIAISEESWDRAASEFQRLVERYPNSAYAGDALYWEAFARGRMGSNSDLKRAVRALDRQKSEYPKAATLVSGEASALSARLSGRLARYGDADAAEAIASIASSAAVLAADAVSAAMPAMAMELGRARGEIESELAKASTEIRAEMAKAGPEMQRELAEARREMAESMRGVSRNSRGSANVPDGCKTEDDDERVEALNALLQMNAEQAMPILKKVLARRDKCSELLRRKAVFLVSQKRTDEAVDILLSTAKSDPDPETREQAVFWLSQTGGDRAVDVLEEILMDKSAEEALQRKAIFSLGQSRSPRAQVILRDYARRREATTEARGEAIFWLGQRRNAENIGFLKEIFESLETNALREKVLFSVAQSRSSEHSKWLLERARDSRLSDDLRKSALFWAGESGAPVADLAAVYDAKGADRELRNQVIFVLSQRRKDQVALDKLLDIAKTEPDRELRRQALFWLGQARDPRAAKLLEEIINKPN